MCVFSREFSEIFKNAFFTDYLRAAASNMWKLQIQLQSNKLWFNKTLVCLTNKQQFTYNGCINITMFR